MDSRKIILKETAVVAAGQLICCGLVLGVFALLGKFNTQVLLGGIFGYIIAVAFFFFMALGAMMAADKAEAQDVAGGQKILKLSLSLRILVTFVLIFALAKSGVCNVIPLALPLVFNRPIASISAYFRKSGE